MSHIDRKCPSHLTRLANGLPVVTVPLRDRPSCALGIWVRAGVRDENKKLNGISHFIEHLLFKGTRSRTATDIKEAIEGKGGSFNAFTAEEATCYMATVPRQEWDRVLGILIDMMLHPRLAPADIAKERAVILEEIKMIRDQPAHYLEEVLDGLLWENHPIGMPLAGTRESISRIRREDLIRYMEHHYSPSHMTVAVSGEVHPRDVVSKVRSCVPSRWGKPKPPERPPYRYNTGPRLKVIRRKTEQVHFAMAVPGLGLEHPDRYALHALNTILGGNMSSRLFHVIREKRALVYDISSSTQSFTDAGSLSIHAGMNPGNLRETLELIFRECELIKRDGVGKGELRRSKEYLLGQLHMGFETTTELMLWAGESVLLLGQVKKLSQIEKGIQVITPRAIQRLARELFVNHSLHSTMIGDIAPAQERRLLKLLRFRSP